MSESDKTFAVVIFQNDNSVSAVPLTWISVDKKTCAWPVKYPANFKKLRKDPTSKPEPDWALLEVDVKKSYSTFETAENKTKKYLKEDAAASSSEVDSTPKSLRSKKFRGRSLTPVNPAVPSGSVHGDSITTIFSGNEAFTVPTLIPFSSSGGDPTSKVDQILDLQSRCQVTDTGNLQTSELDAQQVMHIPSIATTSPGTVHLESGIGFGNQMTLVDDGNIAFSVCDESLKEDINNLHTEFRQFQEIVLQKIEELQAGNRENRRLLQAILSYLPTQQPSVSSCKVFTLILVQTESDYTQLEEEIKNSEDSYQRLVAHLKRGGGSSLSDNVYNLLRGLFTDELTKRFRYTSSSGKIGFGNSKLAEAVRGMSYDRHSVHQSTRTDNSSATDKQISQFIGNWFRQRGYERNARSQTVFVTVDHETPNQISSNSDSDQLGSIDNNSPIDPTNTTNQQK